LQELRFRVQGCGFINISFWNDASKFRVKCLQVAITRFRVKG
jgi:hypothetical protein